MRSGELRLVGIGMCFPLGGAGNEKMSTDVWIGALVIPVP